MTKPMALSIILQDRRMPTHIVTTNCAVYVYLLVVSGLKLQKKMWMISIKIFPVLFNVHEMSVFHM